MACKNHPQGVPVQMTHSEFQEDIGHYSSNLLRSLLELLYIVCIAHTEMEQIQVEGTVSIKIQ